jgi:superfamily I DNA and/or RNA helicase
MWLAVAAGHIKEPCAQVLAIERLLEQQNLKFFQPLALVQVTVSSVDAYQGSEADAVVFSATRSNSRQNIGFVSDPRRLNVAITRPKRALVVVASPSTFSRDKNWSKCDSSC